MEGDVERLNELYLDQMCDAKHCQEVTCVFPLNGNCECFQLALRAFLAEREPSALSQFLKPKFL